MNNAYKNVYKVIMIVTVISMIIACLTQIDVIDLKSETGMIIGEIATMIIAISLLFSRNAGVIANRKNVLGNVITLILFIVLLFFTITLLFDNVELPEFISKVMAHALIISALLTLIFEIPQANTAHGNFQKIVAGAIIITYFIYIGYTKKLESYYEKAWDWGNIDYTQIEKEKKSLESFEKILKIATYISVTGFIINPMLRVYYIDEDYSTMNEIDNILNSSTKNNNYNTAPNPNKMIDPKYLSSNQVQPMPTSQPVVQQQPTPQTTPPMPVEPVAELPREKVINPNFKQNDLPQAVIPTITSEPVQSAPEVDNASNETSTLTIPTANPEPQESTPSTEVQPVVDNTPIESAPAANPEPQESTPSTEVQPITNNQ